MPQKREYLTSHPWLTFEADLQRSGHRLWMNLGAVQSKIRHVANSLLPPEVSRELHEVYLVKGVRATTAIEGNTLSEAQVRKIVQGERSLPASLAYQAKEVQNVVDACNQIGTMVLEGQTTELTVGLIKDYNRLVLNDLPLNDGVVAGEIPTHNVVVANYRGAPRRDCEFLLQRLCEWINHGTQAPSADQIIAFAVIRAILAHLYIAWIHPFGDGNGRTARLLELHLLLSAGVPSVCAHLLSNHYNQTRMEYYRHLDGATKPDGVLRFIEYAVAGLVDGLNEQIGLIDGHQWKATWKEYVYSQFEGKNSQTARRQRQIALDLWGQADGVKSSAIRRMTPQLAEFYAAKSQKSIDRDIKALVAMGLLDSDKGGVRINFRPVVDALLPKRLQVEDSVALPAITKTPVTF